MAISGIDAYKQALMAQQYGAQFQPKEGSSIGGVSPVTPENVTGVGKEIESPSKFDWKNLNKFDGFLTGTAPQTGIGKTSEIPAENIFAVGSGSQALGRAEAGHAYGESNTNLLAELNQIDARDIALNSNKNGLNGQRYINFLA